MDNTTAFGAGRLVKPEASQKTCRNHYVSEAFEEKRKQGDFLPFCFFLFLLNIFIREMAAR